MTKDELQHAWELARGNALALSRVAADMETVASRARSAADFAEWQQRNAGAACLAHHGVPVTHTMSLDWATPARVAGLELDLARALRRVAELERELGDLHRQAARDAYRLAAFDADDSTYLDCPSGGNGEP